MFRLIIKTLFSIFLVFIPLAYAYEHHQEREIINYIGNRLKLENNNPFIMYDDNPPEKWNELKLNRGNTYQFPKIRRRFYGEDISFEFESDNGVMFECSTPVPTLFWDTFLVRSKGEIIICEEKI